MKRHLFNVIFASSFSFFYRFPEEVLTEIVISCDLFSNVASSCVAEFRGGMRPVCDVNNNDNKNRFFMHESRLHVSIERTSG